MSNLDFLYELKNKNAKKCIFLKSKFESYFWHFEFSKNVNLKIDFNLQLGNSENLIDDKHKETLIVLKYWILKSFEPQNGLSFTPKYNANCVRMVLNLFDYLILNKDNSKILESGFSGLSKDFLKGMFEELSKYKPSESIYKVSERVSLFYRQRISKNIKINKNNIGLLTLSEDEVLELKNYIEKNDFKIKDLYPETLLKPMSYPIEIKIKPTYREFDSYYKERNVEPINEKNFKNYINIFVKLDSLRKETEISNLFNNAFDFSFIRKINFKSLSLSGRNETVSSQIIFDCFKKAIEFHYEMGDKIIELHKDAQDKEWRLSHKGKNRYNSLRAHNNIRDLILTYYGATQFVVGTLMARRQSELMSLEAFDAIDQDNSLLKFKRSKSTKGLFGTKDTLVLPIEEVAIEMIKNIELFHDKKDKRPLFSVPSYNNKSLFSKTVDANVYNNNLDKFFDYIESPLIGGKRLYIRQHQLRRFFAMTFFWSGGMKSLDTLRWFLGHTDVEHLYHYITEATPGKVLQSTKASYVLENINKYDNLKSFIETKYNIKEITILDDDEISYCIEELLENEKIEIEPVFFDGEDGKEYEIILKIKEVVK